MVVLVSFAASEWRVATDLWIQYILCVYNDLTQGVLCCATQLGLPQARLACRVWVPMGSTNISVSPSQEGSERDHGSGKFIPDTASRFESWLFEGQDEPQISLIHILPAKETNEFLQFIFPLRARAAKVLSVIQILYYIISTATTGAFHPDQLTAVYIGWRVAYFVGLALLLACALFGDAKLVSKVVHGWYIVATCLNIGILVSGVVLTTLSVGLHIALVATILLAIVTIGSTMHINFLMVFLLSVPEMTALLLSLNRAFSVDNDTQFTKVSLMAFIIIAYIVCIWTVHAVQVRGLALPAYSLDQLTFGISTVQHCDDVHVEQTLLAREDREILAETNGRAPSITPCQHVARHWQSPASIHQRDRRIASLAQRSSSVNFDQ